MRVSGGKPLHAFAPGFLNSARQRDVLHAVHCADDATLLVEQRLDIDENPDARAVAALDDQLQVANALAAAQHTGNRAVFEWNRAAFGIEQPMRAAEAMRPAGVRRQPPK